jgi:hypothetical protein
MVFVAVLGLKRLRRIRIRGVGYRVSLSIMVPGVVGWRIHGLLLLLLEVWGSATDVRS